MAKARVRFSALSLLEEAVHLLRREGFSAALLHWSGSVPFAIGILICWYGLSAGPVSDELCAGASLAMALLLVWMNCRRAVFAGRLCRSLSGASTPAVKGWRLVALQSFLGAIKPLELAISLLVLFPFARSVAFYRTAAALSDREELEPLQVVRRARQLARVAPRESWSLIPLLFLLFLLVWANAALVTAVLPQLVRIFTGYESSFTRSGVYFLQTPLFFLLVLVLAWLAFDPFMQAVYCVRCFHAESLETGEDIRAGLRGIRTALTAAALILATFVLPLRAADGVSQKELEDSVRRTMQAPEYSWRNPPPAVKPGGQVPWIVSITDRLLRSVKSGLQSIGRLIVKILEWLFNHLGVKPNSQGGALPGAGLHWTIYAASGIIIVALVWIIWRRRLFARRKSQPPVAGDVAVVRLDEEGLTADRLPEEGWLELGEQNLRDGNYLLALRAFFLANLAFLGRTEYLAIHPGKTNHEYEVELRRRGRPFPQARELFSGNIASFERAWYGRHAVSREQVEEFRERCAGMKRVLLPQEIAA